MATEKKRYDRDKPIDGSEAFPDALNRQGFAKNLAEIIHIKPNEECFTASLEGPWGYGKSSVIDMVKNELKKRNDPPIVVTFNPWLVSDEESLIQKFLIQFAAQLDIPDRPKETLQVAKELLSYSKLFDVVKLIPGAEPWASTFQTVIKGVGGAANKIGKLKELDLEGRKNKVQEAVAKLGKSIVVVIDDIDRLTPDEAFKVIKISKAVADFKGTSFLLAFDHEYLADALDRYGIKNSNQYVEKVVQLRVPLPLIALEDLQFLCDKYLNELSEGNLTDNYSEDSDRLGYVFDRHIKHLIKTPRQLKRIFNHLRFVLAETEGEVCFSDLFFLSVLAIKAPSIYDDIKNNPVRYVGQEFHQDFYAQKKDIEEADKKSKIESLMQSLHFSEVRHIYSLLGEIFPQVSDKKHSIFSKEYDQQGRVAAPNRLYVALHYRVPTALLSQSDFYLYVAGSVDREEFVNQVLETNRMERFFDLLSHNVASLKDNTFLVLSSLYEVLLYSKAVEKQADANYGFFSKHIMQHLEWATRDVIENYPDKKHLIESVVREPKFLPISSEILNDLFKQHKVFEDDDSSGQPKFWLEEQDFESIKSLWLSVVQGEIENSTFLSSVHSSGVYFLLRRAFPDTLKNIFSQWSKCENYLKRVAYFVGRYGSDSMNGPYIELNLEDFSNFLDLESLQTLARTQLDNEPELEPYFRAVYSSILTGEKFYLRDGRKGAKH